MVGSHEGEPCRLFDQAIYTYLISCRVGSSCRVGLSSQASQPDPSSRVQLLNPTRHFSKKIPTRPDAVSLLWNVNTRNARLTAIRNECLFRFCNQRVQDLSWNICLQRVDNEVSVIFWLVSFEIVSCEVIRIHFNTLFLIQRFIFLFLKRSQKWRVDC